MSRGKLLLSSADDEGRFPRINAPLEVRVTVRFLDPVIHSVYNRKYESSQTLDPTDRICRGLVRRIQHCSEELITRKDSDALTPPAHCQGKPPRAARFEMDFRVYRKETGLWSHQTFRSYQKQSLRSDAAKEVVASTHRVVGLFLRRHDADFQWINDPVPEYGSEESVVHHPSVSGPLSLSCVPRARFLEASQSWEFVPGYTLELTLRSCSQFRREQPEWNRTLRVTSTQNTPLTLAMGEELVWRAYKSVQESFDARKHLVDSEHRACDSLDGMHDCQHFDDNAVDIALRMSNHLGPAYEHLHRTLRSNLRLFSYPDCTDCEDFVQELQSQFERMRDDFDGRLAKLHDFDFRIVDLRGRGWQASNPARFVLDSSASYSRRSIAAILDRIQTGVADVLRGNEVAIHMVAFKRGHLVLDKALVARASREASTQGLTETPESRQVFFVSQLKGRVQRDLDLIFHDTCSIDDILDEPLEKHQKIASPEARTDNTPVRPSSPAPAEASTPSTPSRRVFPLVPSRYRLSSDSATLIDDSIDDLMSLSLPPPPPSAPVAEEAAVSAAAGHEAAGADEVVAASEEAPSAERDATPVAQPAIPEDTPAEMPTEAPTPSAEAEVKAGQTRDVPRTPELRAQHSIRTIDGEPSSRPSTPGLSLGGDASPSASLLATPTLVRSAPTARELVIREPEVALELGTPGPSTAEGQLEVAFGRVKDDFEPCLPSGSPYPTPPESAAASVNLEAEEAEQAAVAADEDHEESSTGGTEVPPVLEHADAEEEAFLVQAGPFGVDEEQQSIQSALVVPAETASATEEEVEPLSDSAPHEVPIIVTLGEKEEAVAEEGTREIEPPANAKEVRSELENDAVSTASDGEHADTEEPEPLLRIQDTSSGSDEVAVSTPAEQDEQAALEPQDIELPSDSDSISLSSSGSQYAEEEADDDGVGETQVLSASAVLLSPITPTMSDIGESGSAFGSEIQPVEEDHVTVAIDGETLVESDAAVAAEASEAENVRSYYEEMCRSKVDFFEDTGEFDAEPSMVPLPEEDEDVADAEQPDPDASVPSLAEDLTERLSDTAQDASLAVIEEPRPDPDDGFAVEPALMAVSDPVRDNQPATQLIADDIGDRGAPVEDVVTPFATITPGLLLDEGPAAGDYFGLLPDPFPASETPEPHPGGQGHRAFEPFLSPVHSPHLLPPFHFAPPPGRTGSVSSDWEDCGSSRRTATPRDSVDTIYPEDYAVDEEGQAHAPATPRRPAAPAARLSTPTAGYLGLHEARLVEMGLRGALAGSRRFDTPRPDTAGSDLTLRPATAGAAPPGGNGGGGGGGGGGVRAAARAVRVPHRRSRSTGFKAAFKVPKPSAAAAGPKARRGGRALTSAGPGEQAPEAEAEAAREGGVLPRVMMLFGGLAIASQMINKSS